MQQASKPTLIAHVLGPLLLIHKARNLDDTKILLLYFNSFPVAFSETFTGTAPLISSCFLLFMLVTFISHFLDNLLKKLHTSNTRLHTTSNFRRLKSCWINSSQVDPVQLVPTLSSPSFPPRKSYYFLGGCASEEIQISTAESQDTSCFTKLCLWRADGDIRRLPHAAWCRRNKNKNMHIYPPVGFPHPRGICLQSKDTCDTAPATAQTPTETKTVTWSTSIRKNKEKSTNETVCLHQHQLQTPAIVRNLLSCPLLHQTFNNCSK